MSNDNLNKNNEGENPSPLESKNNEGENSSPLESKNNEGENSSPLESINLGMDAVSQENQNIPEKDTSSNKLETEGIPALEVEGGLRVFFKPKNIYTHLIELHSEEWGEDQETQKKTISIGRRSTEDAIYPDIDLWKFFFNDGDEYISRRHARLFEDGGNFYFQDLSGKGSTWINGKGDENRLIKSETSEGKHMLMQGDRIFISDSIVFRYVILPVPSDDE